MHTSKHDLYMVEVQVQMRIVTVRWGWAWLVKRDQLIVHRRQSLRTTLGRRFHHTLPHFEEVLSYQKKHYFENLHLTPQRQSSSRGQPAKRLTVPSSKESAQMEYAATVRASPSNTQEALVDSSHNIDNITSRRNHTVLLGPPRSDMPCCGTGQSTPHRRSSLVPLMSWSCSFHCS